MQYYLWFLKKYHNSNDRFKFNFAKKNVHTAVWIKEEIWEQSYFVSKSKHEENQ